MRQSSQTRQRLIIYFVIKGSCIDRACVPMLSGVFGELPASLLAATGKA
jgi:hypothetical protein